MSELLEAVLVRADHAMGAALKHGEYVVMDVDKGSYFGFEGVGGRIWALFESPARVTDVVARLCTEYEVDPEVGRAESLAFIAELLAEGLLVPAP